ncbi:glutamate-5-semialdehyde dehydrogenase [Arenibacter sp. GZD96]|uniref:glutamate-5-semialdehyde dehydrogenase n=1 Tax=Aurantibrevibacter litoralis TaxID=3106030 RepID=UPI002AFE355F|nr:glutamate-5-semialdehyde dehydrogenase [Arenibacter sp. GZD-96]MEA1787533.1 glutamate-5-semialdehyde dehydrogenase [Arenibacter sp. GZD-96]
MKLIKTEVKNRVLETMCQLLDENRKYILKANQKDLDLFDKSDKAMYDRLILDDSKVDAMIRAIKEVAAHEDPVGRVISTVEKEDGLKIINKTAPFGTIMIIYESRPDVTIEAAVLAFKANNKILLKGGKEALHSNVFLVGLWHQALKENGLGSEYIQLLTMDRTQTQAFLRNPTEPLDLIVPRGGEQLIAFVKEHAQCAVLVSGRGNNFLYVDKESDWQKSIKVILNAKTAKISACNALDKILIHSEIPDYEAKLRELQHILIEKGVTILTDNSVKSVLKDTKSIEDEAIWYQEFLEMKCCIGAVDDVEEAIKKINTYSGGHSATIMTTSQQNATQFMEQVDSAVVYQNASTRFTDGGAMGVGAELAISTEKLHHRGPLGLNELVTNKYYVYGDGHIRS